MKLNDDDSEDFSTYSKKITIYNKEIFNNIASDINISGDEYVKDIEKKKKRNGETKKTYSQYILKYSKNYDKEELDSFQLSEVTEIYEKIKAERKPFALKLIKFLID